MHQTAVMDSINIFDLPDAILAKIFINVSRSDLRNLTNVCSRFYTVIGADSQLMSRLQMTVSWSKRNLESLDVQALLASERKFQRMNINCVKRIAPELEIFLTKHATTLNTLNIYMCSFKSSEFGSALLALAESLMKLELSSVEIEVDTAVRPIPFKKLTNLNLGSSSEFGFFMGATTVTDLHLCVMYAEIDEFSKFVQTLDGLTTLNIFHASSTLFSEEFNRMCRFRLKTFVFDSGSFFSGRSMRMNQHFWTFIEMQRYTMEFLDLSCVDIDRMDVLVGMTKLQELQLSVCNFFPNSNPLVENTSIANLTLDECKVESMNRILLSDLIRKCSRLELINLYSMNLGFETVFAIRKSYIKSLKLGNCSYFPMPIPSLKTLHISGDDMDAHDFTNALRLLLFNEQLKDLRVPTELSLDPAFAQAIEEMNLDNFETSM